jgi:hypothetical protein
MTRRTASGLLSVTRRYSGLRPRHSRYTPDRKTTGLADLHGELPQLEHFHNLDTP